MTIRFIFCLFLFASSQCASQIEKEIVLVNIEKLNRADIAKVISAINRLKPRVIAVDLQFDEKKDVESDRELALALFESKNLVMPSFVHDIAGKVFIANTSRAEFTPPSARFGFINTLSDSDGVGTLRKFLVYEASSVFGQSVEYHFAIRTAMVYDSSKVVKFVRNSRKTQEIDFKEGKRHFTKYRATDCLTGKLTQKDVKNKIVMIGFLGPGNEDKFYTPLNKNSSEADMYGVEYLANVVAQVLE